MDGRESSLHKMTLHKMPLQKMFFASLALASQQAIVHADEFIRQPARNQPPAVAAQPTTQVSPAQALPAPSLTIAEFPQTTPIRTMTVGTVSPPSVSPPSVTLTAAQHAPASSDMVMLEPPQDQPPTQFATPSYPSLSSNGNSVTNWQPRNGRSQVAAASQQANGNSAFSNTPLGVQERRSDSRPMASDAMGLPEVPPSAYQLRDVKYAMQSTPEREAALAEQRARKELAAKISNEIMVGNDPAGSSMTPAVGSLESAPGWHAVREPLKRHIDRCESLLSRKAYLSAIEEAHQGVIMLARVLDLRQNKLTSEPAWGAAQQALREALEFTSITRIANDTVLFKRVIQAHETPTLKHTDVSQMTPLAAAQHYLAYAEVQLVEASQGHPWFSELYYCIGRALQMQAEENQWQSDALLQQALTYYRSAYRIHPNNSTNANQLGYVLLRMDRPSEALEQLIATVNQPDCPIATWQNLIQASSRLGDTRTEQWAMQNFMAIKARMNEPSGPTATLVEVSPMQFAALSPYTSGPQAHSQAQSPVGQYGVSSGLGSGQAYQPAQVPTPAPPLQSAPTPSSTPTRTAKAPWSGLFR